jgi:hypothetical protein
MPEPTQTLCSIIPQPERRTYQFTAVLGDLLHKQDCYILYQDYGPQVELYFSNENQAYYLRKFFSKLVPEPAQPGQVPSDHTLGTIFEFHYFCDLHFRLAYQRWFIDQVQSPVSVPPHLTIPTPLSAPRFPALIASEVVNPSEPSSDFS